MKQKLFFLMQLLTTLEKELSLKYPDKKKTQDIQREIKKILSEL